MEERITESEQLAFAEALRQVLLLEQSHEGIGQLGEKKLHLTLKYAYQPNAAFHEQKVGRFVADAVTETGIVEIQTANYGHLREKLAAFSALVPVTVVCPIPHRKIVTWVDPASGELSAERKSPKVGTFLDAFWELSHIRDCLLLPNVIFRLLLIDVKEYRYQNGWGRDGKRGSTRCERVPLSLAGAYSLSCVRDYAAMLPEDLPSPFTVAECASRLRLSRERTATFLFVLREVGAIVRVGKRGNAFLYETIKQ